MTFSAASMIAGQRRAGRPVHLGAFAGRDRLALRHILDAGRGQIGSGVDGKHARHCRRLSSIDRVDDAVRVAAAHDHAVGVTWEVQVVGVAALAAQQHRVFVARHRLADRELAEGELVEIDVTIHPQNLTAPGPADRPARSACRRKSLT